MPDISAQTLLLRVEIALRHALTATLGSKLMPIDEADKHAIRTLTELETYNEESGLKA